MPFEYFDTNQIIPFLIAIPLFLVSIILFKQNEKISVTLLFVGTIVLGFFMANLDPFLNLWDEQYHALVAKNLTNNPLAPILLSKNHFEYQYSNWAANYIWLHKQPLFLWQIALSIKLFGANEIAVRVPSILMHAVIPLMIYRIGSISLDKRIGYIAAVLFALSYFPLELIVGKYSTDHNDMAFLFYVTGSFWGWYEYQSSKNKYWLFIIGIFSGGAVLIKWLTGLLIFGAWGFSLIFENGIKHFKLKSLSPLLIAACVSLLVFLPWQIYIHLYFPIEAGYELKLNAQHFFSAIEGHTGSFSFHFHDAIKVLYGNGALVPFVLLAGAILLIYRTKSQSYKLVMGFTILFTYAFFTLAATKMIAFTIIVMPFLLLGISVLIDEVLRWMEKKISRTFIFQTIFTILMLIIGSSLLRMSKIQNYHTMWKPNDNFKRSDDLKEMKFIQSLKEDHGDEKMIIFNATITLNGHIPIMFYTEHTAYNFIPTTEQLATAINSKQKIAVIDNGKLPDYIDKDDRILKLQL